MKAIKFLSMAGFMLMGMFTLVACGDDDEGGGGAAPTAPGVITAGDGEGAALLARVTSVGDARFYYKDNGQLDYFRFGSGYIYRFDGNNVTVADSYSDEVDYTMNVGYNRSGYISNFTLNFGKSHANGNLSYDGNGQLTKISISGSGSGYSVTATYTLTWNNKSISKLVYEEKETEGRETEYETETYTFEYDGDYDNKYQQMTESVLDGIEMIDGFEYVGYIGLLGKGSLRLPTSVNRSSVYSDGDTYSYTTRYSYGFNSNGTLSYCKSNYNTYYYSYDNVDSKAKALVSNDVQVEKPLKKRLLSKLFRKN